ncbi:Probable pectate lyase F; Flags: Precursor [Serendipita indica DSM 11827]|nr:Probable pectate lyase F; Flags: Precursor [Serendipita indica DSM 11827]
MWKVLVLLALSVQSFAAVLEVRSDAHLQKRCSASSNFPNPSTTISGKSAITVESGKTFDGGNKRYDRGSGACSGQSEGGDSDAVFIVKAGGTLKNVVIGKNQAEGVHCTGYCTLQNVWFEDVCEDAITIKGDKAGQTSQIIGGGALKASDKVIQHNGCGTVKITNFYAKTYGKLYRSCGNCKTQCQRKVIISGVEARGGNDLAGINKNYGDTASITNSCYDTAHPCVLYDGNSTGAEPKKLGYC